MIQTRRAFLFKCAAIGAVTFPATALAEAPIELEWSDLVPREGGTKLDDLRSLSIIQHGEMSMPLDQKTGGMVTDQYNGKLVRIPGYLVPLEFEDTAVVTALLVPFVGACVHVPPPPPNQLIFLTTETPYKSEGLFEPVQVTGRFGTSVTETQLAEVGYELSAEKIEPYE